MANTSRAKVFAVIDELGVDPLRDKSFDAIASVDDFTWHVIQPEEEHNGPLLAYNLYLNENYWRMLLIYNNIPDMFMLKAGMRIKKPSLALVSSALNDVLIDFPERIVEI